MTKVEKKLDRDNLTSQLSSHDICCLMLACTNAYFDSGDEKWFELRGKLKIQLEELDRQLEEM